MKIKEITYDQYNTLIEIIPEYKKLKREITLDGIVVNVENIQMTSSRFGPIPQILYEDHYYSYSALKVKIVIPDDTDFIPTFDEFNKREKESKPLKLRSGLTVINENGRIYP